ncbi:hypothetical protein [Listeria costaricensis]|uniref:hypothetical protein n=1 Tax=Listeria costaricensis TaxID=2026604 RepID=UPI000C06BBFE|nr:hypothetical protein [Listeria costaricensis]
MILSTMYVSGVGLALFFWLVSFIVAKLGGYSPFWVGFIANCGLFLLFFIAKSAFPAEEVVALQQIILGIGTIILLCLMFFSSRFLFKTAVMRKS